MSVDHPDCIGSTGVQDFIVRVTVEETGEPLRSAKVVVTHEAPEILAMAYTDHNGRARIQLEWPPAGFVDLTVSHMLHRPYLGWIETTPDGADITALHPEAAVQGEEVGVDALGFGWDEEVKMTLGDTLLESLEAVNGALAAPAGFAVPVPFDMDWHNLLAEFALTAFIHGQSIGGANFAVTKGKCPPDTGCQAACFPTCAGKECGWDGCHGECGSCAESHLCMDYLCVALPVEVACGDDSCGEGEDCETCPADCGECPLCPPGEHDGGLGECVPEGQCSPGFANPGDGSCQLQPFHLPFEGMATNDEGVAAWWADGSGLEPFGDGHPIPPPWDECFTIWGIYEFADAYHYIASPDYPAGDPINPDSPGSAHMLTDMTGFPNFQATLAAHGFVPSQVSFSFGYMTLGDDVEGQGWFFNNGMETRIYTGGTFTLRVDGKDAVSCTTPPLTMVIDYKTQQSCADDVISIQTDPVLPTACWDSSEAAGDDVKDAAAGFLADLELAGSIHAVMSSIQPAYDESFIGGGREGGYLNIVNMAIDGL